MKTEISPFQYQSLENILYKKIQDIIVETLISKKLTPLEELNNLLDYLDEVTDNKLEAFVCELLNEFFEIKNKTL